MAFHTSLLLCSVIGASDGGEELPFAFHQKQYDSPLEPSLSMGFAATDDAVDLGEGYPTDLSPRTVIK